jgi:hypothetical protein
MCSHDSALPGRVAWRHSHDRQDREIARCGAASRFWSLLCPQFRESADWSGRTERTPEDHAFGSPSKGTRLTTAPHNRPTDRTEGQSCMLNAVKQWARRYCGMFVTSVRIHLVNLFSCGVYRARAVPAGLPRRAHFFSSPEQYIAQGEQRLPFQWR